AFVAGTAIVLALTVGLAASIWQFAAKVRALDAANKAKAEHARERRRAEDEAGRARKAETAERERRQESLNRLARLRGANGNRLAEEGDYLGALAWFVSAIELEKENPARVGMHRRRIDALLPRSPKLIQLWQESIPDPLFASFTKDGKRLLTAKTSKAEL